MADYTSLSDAQLISLLKEEDHYAFTELYRRYWAKLYLYARKLVHDDHDLATDITQDVLTYIWEKRLSLQITDSFSGYLYTSVRRKMFMHVRHTKIHERFLNFLTDFEEKGEWLTDQYILEKELLKEIDHIIDNMPPRMKEVFMLSRYEKLSRKLIAEKLNISAEAVKHQINSALKIFKRKINH